MHIHLPDIVQILSEIFRILIVIFDYSAIIYKIMRLCDAQDVQDDFPRS